MLQLHATSVTFGTTPAAGVSRPRTSHVRPATEMDVGQLVEMLRVMHADSSLRGIEFDEAKLRGFLRRVITASDHACLVYESASKRLDGVMIGYVTEHFFSRQKGASDILLFVRPERRGGIAAARLWTAFKDWARRAGATSLSFGTMAGGAPDRTRRFYTGLGMTEVGSIYRLELAR
jgi:GNAT superfamily N-acetyltransferase